MDLAATLWADLYASGDRERLAEFLTLIAFSGEALQATPPEALRAAIDTLAAIIPAGTPEHTDLVRRIDVRDDLSRITVPTLVVSTTADPLVSPALRRELADRIPAPAWCPSPPATCRSPNAPRTDRS